MRIDFNGEEGIDAPKEKAIAFISSPEKMSQCIPDSSGFVKTGEQSFNIKVAVGIGVVKGTFSISGSVSKSGDENINYYLEGGGFGNRVVVNLSIRVEGDISGCVLSWKAGFDLSGIISGIGESIIRKVSESKIEVILGNVKNSLAT